MSILIKGTEMPTGNDELRLIIRSNGQVVISHKTHYEEAEAVSVPKHGRLIDADALDIYRREEQAWHDYEQNPDNEYLEGVKDGLHEAAKQLSTVPTIILAEKAPAEDINVPGTYDLLYEEGGPDTR